MQQCPTAACRAPRLITAAARTTPRLRPAACCIWPPARRPASFTYPNTRIAVDHPPSPASLCCRSSKFEQLVKSLLDRTVQPCLSCMKDAGVQPADIQEVLMVGGMSRMPKVSSILRRG